MGMYTILRYVLLLLIHNIHKSTPKFNYRTVIALLSTNNSVPYYVKKYAFDQLVYYSYSNTDMTAKKRTFFNENV